MEFPQDFGEDGGHRQSGEGDAHVTDLPAGERSEIGRDGGKAAQQRLDPLEEEAAGRGNLDSAACAVQQVGIERGFELGNRAAERGLSDGEALGGLAEMQLPGDLTKVNEVTEFEGQLILARQRWKSLECGVWSLALQG